MDEKRMDDVITPSEGTANQEYVAEIRKHFRLLDGQ